ncbi:spore germination protein [Haloplasma contractile]|uniref:GerA spore germination protein n=1 Tax=Haloplasma contractile SSD-17B TaxID=1033810 RepID=U2FR33_9MOLU|nr:spore germination protein [Haloplasma contractile]ERJ13454.1 GerA spore germination protein [Haloplasma contractile SSD-17B]
MRKNKTIEHMQDNIRDYLNYEKSFDIVKRDVSVADKRGFLVFVDGFAKDDMMLIILSVLQQIKHTGYSITDVKKFIDDNIGYIEVETQTDYEKVSTAVLSGMSALFIDGFEEVILIDSRTYPARGPEEPDLEKLTRGSHDGLVETLVFNTALVRRRIRDKGLFFELLSVGKRSKTDVVLGYIDDLVDQQLLEDIKQKISEVNVSSLVMSEKSLEEKLVNKPWYNPFPSVRYTERPDVLSAHLLEGHIAIIVDNSPSAMIVPTTFFYFLQSAEDYIHSALVGNFIRFTRLLLLTSSLLLVPLWLLLVEYVDILPEWLAFLGPKGDDFAIPLFIQFLILEVGLIGLRITSIHTPNALSTSLGIIGGLILSQFAIDVGWFVPETILYMAIVGLGQFATPSIELSYAIRIFRLFFLIITGVFSYFGLAPWGLGGSFLIYLIILATTNTVGKKSYLWPLIPFNGKKLRQIIFRMPFAKVESETHTK